MPRPVKGYLTDSNIFFDTYDEAELHEATKALERKLTEDLEIDPDKFIPILLTVAFVECSRAIEAQARVNARENANAQLETGASAHNDERREEDAQAVVEQPLGKPERLSNLRHRR